MLPSHIQALLSRDAYPERPEAIELRQTHISYLLFTPRFVYKIKKPVAFGFLDFSTLDKRRFFCDEEVRLNNRLAPDVYLGVVEVVEKDGRVSLGGPGVVKDYAVKMKRLGAETMLEDMLEKDAVTPGVIKKVAQRIAGFHMKATTDGRISGYGRPEAVRENTDENFLQTEAAIGLTATRETYDEIRRYTDGFLRDNEKALADRVERGFIRDCHGDIHLENISLDDGVRIFDCIEFNERFRFSDVVADIAFLAMDMDFHNRADLTTALEDEYFAETNDADGRTLLGFYKCYRAYVRGKVDSLKSVEPEVDEEEKRKARFSAMRHFHLSRGYARGGIRPKMIVVAGLSGSGKTTVGVALSRIFFAPLLSSDAIRKELAGIRPETRAIEGFKTGIYSEGFTEKTYDALIDRGAALLAKRRTCILDATFSKAGLLEKARKTAIKAGMEPEDFHIVEMTAPDEITRERFLKREKKDDKEGRAVSDMRWDIYQNQKAAFEPINRPHISCGPDAPEHENIDTIMRKLLA